MTTLSKIGFRARLAGWHVLTRLVGERDYRFTLPDGSVLDYPLKSAVGKHLFAGGFESAEVTFVLSRLKAGDVVLDVGANGGVYTLLAAKAVGDAGHVYAFEPDKQALRLLRHNLELNAVTNVTVVPAAVSNHAGEASFAVADDVAMGSLADIERPDQRIGRWETVETVRLDDMIDRFGIRSVDFIKMDVEGAEKLALEGATGLLSSARAPAAILFEAFDANARAFGYAVEVLFALLRAHHYTILGMEHSGALRPVDEIPSEQIGTTVYNFVAERRMLPSS